MKLNIFFMSIGLLFLIGLSGAEAQVQWSRMSSSTAEIPTPNQGDQQTCAVVADFDNDGRDDFVIGERTKTPSIVWYRFNGQEFQRFVIDNEHLNPEAGGDVCDVDGDGDMDLILGQDASGNDIWWWENPYPDFSEPWKRRYIKNGGANKHHDQSCADYDGDGQIELVTWNQGGNQLLLYDIPADPKSADAWSPLVIYTWEGDPQLEGFPSVPVDINQDGQVDIVGGGRWFEHLGKHEFEAHFIDADMRFTQCAAGQLVQGGRPEIVFSPGDTDGDAKWYHWKNGEWVGETLRYVNHGHTCEIRDVDQDGNPDIMIGEMGDPGAGDSAKTYIWYGDGNGNLTEAVALKGQGIHEGLFGDFDGDRDQDILVKPYHHNNPRLDVLFNRGTRPAGFKSWQRHHIADLPERSIFINGADIDGDGHRDLVAGGWWWKNPGEVDGSWEQKTIGEPMKNMAAVFDADRDGDFDVLGTLGVGSEANHQFVWAENSGSGEFRIHKNIQTGGTGDFLQGCQVVTFMDTTRVLLSWHNGGGGLQALVVPENPVEQLWKFTVLSEFTEKEDISTGDIDGDSDLDILTGEHWMEKSGNSYEVHRLGELAQEGAEADRNDLADVNGDGRLDAIVSLENGTHVYWFESPEDPTGEWNRRRIGEVPGQGFSMDTDDFDYDGDPDVVIGEHRGEETNRVVIFENRYHGTQWIEHVIDSGSTETIDHHDGTVIIDMDNDEDLDIISIGWYNPKVWIFENRSRSQ